MSVATGWVLSYLVNSLWQVPLLLGAGALAARGLRQLGIGVEHRVWVAVLLLESVLPACSLAGNGWTHALAWLVGSAHGDASGVTVVLNASPFHHAVGLQAGVFVAAAVLYLAVCCYFAARFVWGCWQVSLLRRDCAPVQLTGGAAALWAACGAWCTGDAAFGETRIAIASSDRVAGPVSLGVVQRLILVPTGMLRTMTDTDLCTVIAHEWAHLRRNDFLKNLLYELVTLPVAYHPLFRLTRGRVVESREMVCDQMAARSSGPEAYGRSLLRLASLFVPGEPVRVSHAIGIFDANAFERRVMQLTKVESEMKGRKRWEMLAACGVLGLAMCGSAVALGVHVSAPAAVNASNGAEPLKIPAGEMAGNKISGSNPVYPLDAKKARIEGKVVLHAVISKEGSIEHLDAVSGPEKLQKSSLDAVRDWKYTPYLLNGEPVAVETTINVTYHLAN